MKPYTIESPVGAEILLDGRRYVSFVGSSYLGMAANPAVVERGITELRESGSRYQLPRHYHISSRAHLEAESEAAAFFDTEGALFLAAGYFFGLIAISAMREKFRAIFYDEWAHYSLREAVASSGLKNFSFRHLDCEDLDAQIKQHVRAGERPLVVTDGLYSSFGEIAPLANIARSIEPYDGHLLIDESHSFGALGDLGRGAGEHHRLPAASTTIGGSTGKAFGVSGGIIPASVSEIQAFRATPVGRGAAEGSPAAARMFATSLRYVRDHPELLKKLRENTDYLKMSLRSLGLEVADNTAPIASFVLGSHEAMQTLQQRLMSEGIFVLHSTYMAPGTAGAIRCCIFADHSREQLDLLVSTLRRFL